MIQHMQTSSSPDSDLMTTTLSVAVPMWIERMRGMSFEERKALGDAQPILERGDVLMFGSKKRGEVAEVFNTLACNIAILSYAPGGVDCFGLHFETVETEDI